MAKQLWLRAIALTLAVFMVACLAVACGGGTGDTSSNGGQTDQTGSDKDNVTSYEEEMIGGDDSSDEQTGTESEGEGPEDSDNSTTESGSTTPGTTTSTSNGKTNNTTSQQSSGTKNMNGRVITIALFSESLKAAFTDSAEGIFADSIREVAKKYNCKFKIVSVPILDLIAQVEQDAMSGTATWDVTSVEGYHVVPKQCVTGYYLCMSDYYNFNDGVWNGSWAENMGVFNGKRYAVPMGLGGDMGLFYNKNLVKAANLQDPWTYVDNNTWNWDNFKKFTKALTKDTDNDGQPNQFGHVNENPYMQFIMTNGAQVIDLSSGRGKLGIDTPAAKEAMNFVLSLYDEQIIPTGEQIGEQGLSDAFNAMASGKVASFTYGAAYGPWLAENAGLDWDDIGWTYLPKGPRAKDYVSPTFTPPTMLMIQRYAKDPADVVLALQDVMAFWSKNHKSKMTVEQMREKNSKQDYIVDFLQGRHLELYKKLPSLEACVNALSYTATGAYDTLLTMFYEITTKKYTVQAGVDAYKSAIQSAITEMETTENK